MRSQPAKSMGRSVANAHESAATPPDFIRDFVTFFGSMKDVTHTRSRFARALFFLAIVAIFVATACNEKNPSEENPTTYGELEPDGTDAEGRPIYTCTGELCYDPEDPTTQERRDELIGIAEMAFSESETYEEDMQRFRDTMQDWSDSYAACNYKLDESTQLIQIDCPDWIEVSSCPGEFFKLTDTSGLFRPRRAPTHRRYCIPSNLPISQRACRLHLGCASGEVCTGMLSAVRSDNGVMAHGLWCLPATSCEALEKRYDIHDDQSCFYPDFTTVEDPAAVQEPASCAEIASGMCTRSCACPDPNDTVSEVLGNEAYCEMLSEKNTVGLCSVDTCASNNDCAIYGGKICAQYTDLPAWAATHYQAILDGVTSILSERPKPGFCVSKSVCDAWNNTHDQQLRCGVVRNDP